MAIKDWFTRKPRVKPTDPFRVKGHKRDEKGKISIESEGTPYCYSQEAHKICHELRDNRLKLSDLDTEGYSEELKAALPIIWTCFYKGKD